MGTAGTIVFEVKIAIVHGEDSQYYVDTINAKSGNIVRKSTLGPFDTEAKA
jgi:uncharacterized membrane protein YkoI